MKKNVSVMCFHDELCQVFNALMTAKYYKEVVIPADMNLTF